MTSCLLLLLLPLLAAGQQLLKNADFESTNYHGNWFPVNCNISSSSNSHSGSHSIQVTNRHQRSDGVSQSINVQLNHRYLVKCYIKLLNKKSNHLYESVEVMVDVKDNHDQHHHDMVGKNPRVTPGDWHAIGGDIHITHPVKTARLYVQGGTASVNYLLDSCSVTPLQNSLSNFPKDANQRIDKYRKANIKVSLAGSVHPSGLEVQLHQTKSEFGWGTAVRMKVLNDPNQKAYRQYIYDNFEWAVFEGGLKWPQCEPQQGHVNYDRQTQALNTLLSHGIKVRGHNIVWAVNHFVPKWQRGMSSSDLRKAVTSRVKSVVGTFKGKLLHWDVNNENLHDDYYASKLHDADFTNWLFKQAHSADPKVKLFLNEFDLVISNRLTVAQVDQANQMKRKGVPVYGIGVQSHLSHHVDIAAIQHRLDELSEAGLPLWVTELDITESHEDRKAQLYDDVLRLYFAHPKVEGVLFWGFSDQHHWRPNAALTDGSNMSPNAAGRRVHHLIRELWRTDETHNISPGHTVNVRGFKGEYELLVKHHGKVIHTEKFYNGGSGATLSVHLEGSGNSPHVHNVVVG